MTLRRPHPAWLVAAVAFIALVGAAGFRATPSVLLQPLHQEFGWSLGTISAAVSVNLLLYGLTAPFAAALMEKFGMRRVVAGALVLVSAGSGFTVFMEASWQLVLCWGVLVGLGTGSMALGFVAIVANRWFVHRRGLVTGVLTAGGAAGQLVFLPLLARLTGAHGWRVAALTVAAAALIVVPLVWWRLRDRPADLGATAYGAGPDDVASLPATPPGSAARNALRTLRHAAGTRPFWLLAGGFAICGATTNGLVGTHFIPAAHDHGMTETTAAGLLALVGLFDIAGTIASGWLTDRVDSRLLLGGYYALRGLSLLVLPSLFAATAHPSMVVFILFYGLDWVATVPPTVALCREYFGASGAVVFGWVFASHQFGAAIAATSAGLVRDRLGAYDWAWYGAGALALLASLLSLMLLAGRRTRDGGPAGPGIGLAFPAAATPAAPAS
ncbi:MFS transporter [Actinoplanes sp. NBRC 14428]|uniref:Sugar phosphate permease n=1 Tax=Pseudosporangium ferrugineum TaxID=439699 RepID=A0A2T0S3B4_9ACTN|nr:MFS transporter [Pseudosporangium ferrugineum]PRY27897.1 sugar phosphate permease [Pseudosporangium ferrugineum]BCJ52032.1 MFS transporter [Actinoplanes sp. NBRC 14428]